MILERTSKTKQHISKIVFINGIPRRIDKNIVSLIDGLNRLGVSTVSSCGGDCGCCCKRKHKLLYTKRCNKYKGYTFYKYKKPKKCEQSVWLAFASVRDAEKFLNIVYRESDCQKLKDYMLGFGNGNTNAWSWRSGLVDVNDNRCIDHRGYWVGKKTKSSKWRFDCHLTFPHAHLDLVIDRVNERLYRKK